MVTSSAKVRSVSVMLLMVSASAATSPFASRTNFCERSPFATAVTTFTMPRTCVVRFEAMKFTLSVRSFQVPATPGTRAWPPSLPSMPTSRATVRHLIGEGAQRVDHVVDGLGERRDLALRFERRTSGERSPFAMAVTTFTMPRTCFVRFDGHEVHVVGEVLPGAGDARTSAWPPSLPSVPTSFATRVTSAAKEFS